MISSHFIDHFKSRAANFDHATLRVVKTRARKLRVRRAVAEAPVTSNDFGFMLTLSSNGGFGYSAMPSLEVAALDEAFSVASTWVEASRGSLIAKLNPSLQTLESGKYTSTTDEPWEDFPQSE